MHENERYKKLADENTAISLGKHLLMAGDALEACIIDEKESQAIRYLANMEIYLQALKWKLGYERTERERIKTLDIYETSGRII